MWTDLNPTATGGGNIKIATLTDGSQNWVIVSMNGAGTSAGQFSVDFDATSLGNGCSPPAAISTAHQGSVPIGPAGGALVCPPGLSLVLGLPCLAGTPPYLGTNVNP